MKLSVVLALLPAFVSAVSVTFDTLYDNPNVSLRAVACSGSSNGLSIIDRFPTFGTLPNFPHIGGAPAINTFNSPNCGSCWNLTFVNNGVPKTISILAIDASSPDFNIALSAMNDLTSGQAQSIGRAPITAAQVPVVHCGL